MKHNICRLAFFFVFASLLFVFYSSFAFAQTPLASRTDGVNVFYYDTLHEAVAAAGSGISFDIPDEIILLSDIVLGEPVIINDNIHVRLVPGGGSRTIMRGSGNLEHPLFWLSGDSASLSLGKPDEAFDMGWELFIDGGYLNIPPIEAYSPLIAVSGSDSKLVMYDKVVLQNNCNVSTKDRFNSFGGGVFLRQLNELPDRQPEFIMKGGTIRGNINNANLPYPYGGGVLVWDLSTFTMEGGIIMNNAALRIGGGVFVSDRSTFKKTGGIIYGANAPEGFRNIAIEGVGSPKIYGYAVCAGSLDSSLLHYRDDTVKENDLLTHTGSIIGPGVFGKGEKWDNTDKAFMRRLLAVILPVVALGIVVLLIVRAKNKSLKTASAAGLKLSPREKEVFDLLLTDMSFKQIAGILGVGTSGVTFHSQNIYRKLGIKSRTELLVKYK